jgi:hypothetical protein
MSTKTHDLHTFMAQVTSEMASEYERIFAKTAEDPGTAGDEGEENWAQLLREWLPPTYHVATKGRLIATDGTMSPQIDVLVLKPFYPAKLREKKVWIANGVAAAFECKTTLRTEHIASSANRCCKFKKLFPRRTGSPARELRSPLLYGILAHSHAWKAPTSRPGDNVEGALQHAIEGANHPSELIDLVCIADLGCWTGMSVPCYKAAWRPDNAAALKLAFGGDWGPVSSMVGATIHDDKNNKTFQPVGGMLAYLTQRIAWEDHSVRELADYCRLAKLWGQGGGQMHFWPQSIFSDEVKKKIGGGMLTNGEAWSEWSYGLI